MTRLFHTSVGHLRSIKPNAPEAGQQGVLAKGNPPLVLLAHNRKRVHLFENKQINLNIEKKQANESNNVYPHLFLIVLTLISSKYLSLTYIPLTCDWTHTLDLVCVLG